MANGMSSINNHLMSFSAKHVFVCTVADGTLLDMATINEQGELERKDDLPKTMTIQHRQVLRKYVDQTSYSTTSQLVTFEGCPPVVLLHERYADTERKRERDRELIHELEHLNDHEGLGIFAGKGLEGTIHYLVLNALKDVKCEGQCIKNGLGRIVMADLGRYATRAGEKVKSLEKSAASTFIEATLSRYIRLSFLSFRSDLERAKRIRLNKLRAILMKVSEDEVPLCNGVLLKFRKGRSRVNGAVKTRSDGWPSEKPWDIAESVNKVVKRIAYMESGDSLPSLTYREPTSEFVVV